MNGDGPAWVQPEALAQTTAGRIRRMSTHVEDALAHGKPVSVAAALQIAQASLILVVEVTRLAGRDEKAWA